MKFFIDGEPVSFNEASAYCDTHPLNAEWFAQAITGHCEECECELMVIPFTPIHPECKCIAIDVRENAKVAVARIDVADLLARPTVPE